MIRRIKAAFEILKAPYFRTSMVTARGYRHGPTYGRYTITGKKRTTGTEKGGREVTSIWDRWENDEIYRKSQLDTGWSDAWVRYLDHIEQIDISHEATPEQRCRYHHLICVRSVNEDRQAPPSSTRPGYQEAKTALVEMQKQSRRRPLLVFFGQVLVVTVQAQVWLSVLDDGHIQCLPDHLLVDQLVHLLHAVVDVVVT